jgi:type IV secretory pathway VirB2 component (pilin)
MKHVRRWIERISYATTMLAISATSVMAAAAGGGVLPWDGPITTITADMTGPVAHGVTIAAIILAGMAWAHTEHGSGARKLSAVGFGGAVALGATQLMTAVFPFAGALL